MRYATEDACFVQTADIDWAKPGAEQGRFGEAFEPISFAAETNAFVRVISNGAYSGTFKNGYEDGDDYVISNLKINELTGQVRRKMWDCSKDCRAGMCGRNHIKMLRYRTYLTGIIAGSNRERRDVIVEDSKVTAAYYAGGVTGYDHATGVIRQLLDRRFQTGSTVDVDVTAVLSADRTLYIENVGGTKHRITVGTSVVWQVSTAVALTFYEGK